MINSTILAVLTAVGFAAMTAVSAQPTTPRADGDAEHSQRAYWKMPDTVGSGRYPAVMVEEPAFAGHVIYRPRDLGKLGSRRLPVLLWANTGCIDDGASGRLFLEEIASHGYLVIAPGRIKSGPGVPFHVEPARTPPPGKIIPTIETTATDVLAGLDQARAANTNATSPLLDRLDLGRVAVAGHSCGGVQALQLAADPRIKTVMVFDSGIFLNGENPIAGMSVDKGLLSTLHTPVLYVLGGPTDIAYANGTDDFRRIDHVPVIMINLPTGHGGTFMKPRGGEDARIAVAWLQWQLEGDAQAGRMFVGANCGICRTPGAKVERRNIG